MISWHRSRSRASINSRCAKFFAVHTPIPSFFSLLIQGRLHWGQYLTPSFSTLQYKPHDPDFFANIQEFKSIAEKFDPGHLMANGFLNSLIGMEVQAKDKAQAKANFLSRLGGFFRKRKSAKSKSH
jgi:hypothetical protein